MPAILLLQSSTVTWTESPVRTELGEPLTALPCLRARTTCEDITSHLHRDAASPIIGSLPKTELRCLIGKETSKCARVCSQ